MEVSAPAEFLLPELTVEQESGLTLEQDILTPEPSEETPAVEAPESEVITEETNTGTEEPITPAISDESELDSSILTDREASELEVPILEEPAANESEEQILDTPAPSPNSSNGNGNSASNGNGNGSLNKTSTVVKEFVVDYNTETFEPLMEHEVNGLDYKYVYGNDRLSVDITPIPQGANHIIENGDHVRLYYHMDYLGTADYLTSPVSLKVEAWTHYDEWGRITHNAVLKCGQRELDLVKRYATHDYDSVLELYYAKARFYDANGRHFVAMDPILDPSRFDIREYVENPVHLVQYIYVINNPVIQIDLLGLTPTTVLLNLDWSQVDYKFGNRNKEKYVRLDDVWSQLSDYYDSASVSYNPVSHSANFQVRNGSQYVQLQINSRTGRGSASLYSNGRIETIYFDQKIYNGYNYINK